MGHVQLLIAGSWCDATGSTTFELEKTATVRKPSIQPPVAAGTISDVTLEASADILVRLTR